VREAVRGNGPVDKTGTAPRIDFTIHLAPQLADFAAQNKVARNLRRYLA
jgi:hypothetical protein